MSAAEQLKMLHQLQLIDLEIMEIEKFHAQAPERITELEGDISAHRLKVDRHENELKSLIEARRKKEKDLEEHEKHIEKNKERMMAVKTNAEYHAIQKENDAQKAFIEELEDEVLRLMDDIEGAELSVRKAKDRFGEVQKKLQAQIDQIKAKEAEVADKLAAKNEERNVILPQIDDMFFKRYSKLRETTSGIAVVRIINRVCQGCLMSVPPQVYNLVIRNEDIITCPNCCRILYYQEGEEPAKGKPSG